MAVDRGLQRPDRNEGWVVLYPGPDIVVTTWWVDTRGVRYPVSQLSEVTRVEVDGHRARAAAVYAGVVEMAIALPFAAVAGSGLMVVAGLLAAGGVAVGVLVDTRRNPRWMALRAVYNGREVELFQTTHRREFQRVRLAVIRAMEAGGNSRLRG